MPEKRPSPSDCRENFRGDGGRWYLVRCLKCRRENYGPTVATGRCAWCGYDAAKEDDDA